MRVIIRSRVHRVYVVVAMVVVLAAVIVGGLYGMRQAQAAVPPDSCFTMSGGTITAYSTAANCPKNVDIPSTIGGVTVTGIGSQAFYNKALTAGKYPKYGNVNRLNGILCQSNYISAFVFFKPFGDNHSAICIWS